MLLWQEEHTRFAFQNGRARFMRNWPYAVPLLNDPAQSAVAGRFAVAPMPAAPGGNIYRRARRFAAGRQCAQPAASSGLGADLVTCWNRHR